MSKISTKKPILFMLYGFPGSGKTHFARNLCNSLMAAHLSADRIRFELFEQPRYDGAEDTIINHLMEYMAEEFLDAGMSVIYDTNANTHKKRKSIRELAEKSKSECHLVWLQIDAGSAFARIKERDRRKADDKYARIFDPKSYQAYLTEMKHPLENENPIVLSAKHSWQMQQGTIYRRLYDLGLVSADDVSSHVVKPGMINLVPGGRIDYARRHLRIR